jgi:hypothetical protein
MHTEISFVAKAKEKRAFGKPRNKYDSNIKIGF